MLEAAGQEITKQRPTNHIVFAKCVNAWETAIYRSNVLNGADTTHMWVTVFQQRG